MGIEPTSSAWKAEVLPLNYTRQTHCRCIYTGCYPATPFSWWRGEDLLQTSRLPPAAPCAAFEIASGDFVNL